MKRVVILLALLAASACAEPLEFADWTIPVPEGTRVIGYPGVPPEARTERIELAEDLVLGADDTDLNQAFYRPTDVAIDAEGRIFVADSGNHRIQVFDADGSFVTTLGREGQGPGEFTQIWSTIVVGDRLLVSDSRNARVSVFSTDGTYLQDVELGTGLQQMSFVAGVDAGYAVGLYTTFDVEQRSESFGLGALGLDGEETIQYAELPLDRTPTLQRGSRRYFGYGNPRAFPSFAADRSGNVYFTAGDEYQVLALAPDGSAQWALRIAQERSPMPQELRQLVLERVRNSVPDATESEINFVDRLPSIARMVVDGEGRLFVYPYIPPDPEVDGIADVPVDVYSPDGEHLFSGMIPNRRWRRAEGDFVYGVGADRVTGEDRVFRWRLIRPFD